MNTEEFAERLAAISDKELISIADQILGKLCKTGGRSFVMTVPPMITDTDIVFAQVLKRFERLLNPINNDLQIPDVSGRSEQLLCPYCSDGGELYDSILHDVPICKRCGSRAK